ncbi:MULTISPECIES: hypothetical protein [unclassified Moorena]|nr:MULTISPECIES: hypothetical protein [unclassified Moorena]
MRYSIEVAHPYSLFPILSSLFSVPVIRCYLFPKIPKLCTS